MLTGTGYCTAEPSLKKLNSGPLSVNLTVSFWLECSASSSFSEPSLLELSTSFEIDKCYLELTMIELFAGGRSLIERLEKSC